MKIELIILLLALFLLIVASIAMLYANNVHKKAVDKLDMAQRIYDQLKRP